MNIDKSKVLSAAGRRDLAFDVIPLLSKKGQDGSLSVSSFHILYMLNMLNPACN